MSSTAAVQATEVAARAGFTDLRYAQCWEDADVLSRALVVGPSHTVLSVASAGDNTLALLADDPDRVIAVDLSAAQLAALSLRMAAYATLQHDELLELMGSRPSRRRRELYARCRSRLPAEARAWWDAHPAAVHMGIGAAGRFERYFALFRRWILPLVHSRSTRGALLSPRPSDARARFHDDVWDTRRWRWLFRAFFSEWMLGRLGRDPAFFTYVEGAVGERLRARVRYALVTLDPSENPYLHWILTGEHPTVLPRALRPDVVERIRPRLDRIELHHGAIESLLSSGRLAQVHRFNLSNIFEYMSEHAQQALLTSCLTVAPAGARLAYWNLLVPRRGAALLPDRLRALRDEADRLHAEDKTFFYSAFVLEEVRG
ncbi:MAG: BtaA family protein [Gemmatimonadaceae bacterium]|nr:BtaA family protein [Gemmatimonadaceae bacterium]